MSTTIGITQPVLLAVPALSLPSAQLVPDAALSAAVPVLPPDGIPDQVSFNAQAAEQSRVETIQKVAQQIANVFVLGDQTFSLFKDATGQYITRFTSLRDGKVTYIPEPTLFKLGGSADTAPAVKIQA